MKTKQERLKQQQQEIQSLETFKNKIIQEAIKNEKKCERYKALQTKTKEFLKIQEKLEILINVMQYKEKINKINLNSLKKELKELSKILNNYTINEIILRNSALCENVFYELTKEVINYFENTQQKTS